MQVGIHLPHIGRKAGPDAIRRAAIQAEELGFADVWVSEHIIIPKDAQYPPSANFWDPVLTLTWAAACTQRVKLGTSVQVLPGRNPVLLAKQWASLDALSGGRALPAFGLGVVDRNEQQAFGVTREERAPWFEEALPLIRRLWSEDIVDHDGPRFHYDGVRVPLAGLVPEARYRVGDDVFGGAELGSAGVPVPFALAADCDVVVLDRLP